MKLTIWYDFACPYCYIAERLLQDEAKKKNVALDIAYRVFELSPEKTNERTHYNERVMRLNDMNAEEVDALFEEIKELAKEAGIEMDFYRIQDTNTRAAHKTLFFADDDKKAMVFDALMTAYFSEGRDLADRNVLKEILATCGVSFDGLSAYLTDDSVDQRIEEDRKQAQTIAFEVLPYIVAENGRVLTGVVHRGDVSRFLDEAADAQ